MKEDEAQESRSPPRVLPASSPLSSTVAAAPGSDGISAAWLFDVDIDIDLFATTFFLLLRRFRRWRVDVSLLPSSSCASPSCLVEGRRAPPPSPSPSSCVCDTIIIQASPKRNSKIPSTFLYTFHEHDPPSSFVSP